MVGDAHTGAAIVAELLAYKGPDWEPPLWTRWYSTGPNGNGTTWQHTSLGTSAGTWTDISVQSGNIGDKAGQIMSPQGADVLVLWQAPFAGTLTKITGKTVGATSTVTGKVTGHMAADATFTTAGTVQGTITTAAFAAGDWLQFVVTSVANSPVSFALSIEFAYT